MQKTILTTLLALVALTAAAQDRLIRVDSESKAWHKKNSQRTLFDREKARLLMPQGAAFGVECIPSFSPEWSLTYDSLAHALVYKIAEKSIWYTTYRAMHKEKRSRVSITNRYRASIRRTMLPPPPRPTHSPSLQNRFRN